MVVSVPESDLDVAVVGGGPVGLLIGLMLRQKGIATRVFEQRIKPSTHSRSIGVHPPSLKVLTQAGVGEAFDKAGLNIRKGHAIVNGRTAGAIDFSKLSGPFNYVMSIPQYVNEAILEKALEETDPGAMCRGAKVSELTESNDGCELKFEHHDGTLKSIRAKFVIGADGKNSFVRKSLGISFHGKTYPASYLMGDFPNSMQPAHDAFIYLGREGLVESFPLPGNLRRWVVKTPSMIQEAKPEQLTSIIADRTGQALNPTENRMISSFGIQKMEAESFWNGRTVLAGDAAHVISPIGGQGMNLGWLDGALLANKLDAIIKRGADYKTEFADYESQRRKSFREAVKRSELNMWFGKEHRFSLSRHIAAKAITSNFLSAKFARMFTMDGL